MEKLRRGLLKNALLAIEKTLECSATSFYHFQMDEDPDDEGGFKTIVENDFIKHQKQCRMCQIRMSILTMYNMVDQAREKNDIKKVLLAFKLLDENFKDENVPFINILINYTEKTLEILDADSPK